jgi:hypothetical protein
VFWYTLGSKNVLPGYWGMASLSEVKNYI